MINLLPTGQKENITYARRNTVLRNWVIASLVAMAGIGIIVTGGFLYISMSTKAYQREVQLKKERLDAQKLDETQARLEGISSSTKLALTVLSRQIRFSSVLQQVGAVMPSGAVLQNLSVGKLDGGIDLQVIAKDYQTATQVQVNIQDSSNKLFDKADIVSITCASPTPEAPNPYPCQVSIRALFTKNNPFLFINKAGQ